MVRLAMRRLMFSRATISTSVEPRIKAAATILARAIARLEKQDPEMAGRLGNALAEEMQAIREGR